MSKATDTSEGWEKVKHIPSILFILIKEKAFNVIPLRSYPLSYDTSKETGANVCIFSRYARRKLIAAAIMVSERSSCR